MKCKRCGNWIPDGSETCMFCGQKQDINKELSSDFNQGDFFDDKMTTHQDEVFDDETKIGITEYHERAEREKIEHDIKIRNQRTMSIWALVLSVLFPIVGLILGIVSLVKTIHMTGAESAKTMAIISIVLSVVLWVLYIVVGYSMI